MNKKRVKYSDPFLIKPSAMSSQTGLCSLLNEEKDNEKIHPLLAKHYLKFQMGKS